MWNRGGTGTDPRHFVTGGGVTPSDES